MNQMTIENCIRLSECEITYFDEDPDGVEDRAGDGYYYQVPGEAGWSGPWHSEEEAENELRDDLAYKEDKVIKKMLLDEGWIISKYDTVESIFVDVDDKSYPFYLNKIEGRWFEATVFDDCFNINEKNSLDAKSNIVILNKTSVDEEKDEEIIYGNKIALAKSALEALHAAIGTDFHSPKM
jgi:hypothetical protein